MLSFADNVMEDANVSNGQEEGNSKKEQERKVSPLSTLESSFEALNVKKFDVAFAVDPLYHQTSAQFDEGGAKGLLLNNLGVYELDMYSSRNTESGEDRRVIAPQEACNQIAEVVQEALKKMEMVADEKMRMFKKAHRAIGG
ncbi:Condensin complex subunit 2 [Camellia lanceoleosa]|uniref:Condensin complex subunit 2 n=1 Tax=Camellia lanceoleosa TaxID=1840588 RepID=A0ACC0J507_9ERIC|nr:Condensin complex subunit 2 [Camellia lanceoleosa]